jgi:hypothetical protein
LQGKNKKTEILAENLRFYRDLIVQISAFVKLFHDVFPKKAASFSSLESIEKRMILFVKIWIFGQFLQKYKSDYRLKTLCFCCCFGWIYSFFSSKSAMGKYVILRFVQP